MIELLEVNPILLLSLVAAVGFLVGQLRVGGFGLGVILSLAGIGTRSGWTFAETLVHGGVLTLIWVGAILTAGAALLTGHRVLKISLGTLAGILAGLQTQPAVLAFALEKAWDERANLRWQCCSRF